MDGVPTPSVGTASASVRGDVFRIKMLCGRASARPYGKNSVCQATHTQAVNAADALLRVPTEKTYP